MAEINCLVNSRPLFPKTVENLDEDPLTSNLLLYPHGRPVNPQNDLLTYVALAQKFIKIFWYSCMRYFFQIC